MVAADGTGGFVVSWVSNGSPGSDSDGQSIQAQRFSVDGSPEGSQFQVNTYRSGDQRYSATASHGEGFVVAWASDGSSGTDSDGSSIQARRFEISIFSDGFESGDVSAWSQALP